MDTPVITQVNKVNLYLTDRCLKKEKKAHYILLTRDMLKKVERRLKMKEKVREHQVNTKKKERKNKTKQNSRKAHQIDGYFPIDRRNTL